MLIFVVFGFVTRRQTGPLILGGNLLIVFILLALLGWKVFGAAVRG